MSEKTGLLIRLHDRLSLRRFRRDDRGATAVEFGFIALPFFFMMMMIVEMAMIFWTRQVLQEAVSQASRTILTGEARTLYTGSQAAQTAAFRADICNRLKMYDNCATRLHVDVQPLGPSFPASRAASMIAGSAISPTAFVMRPVAPSEIAVVRVAYEVPVFTAGWFGALSKLEPSKKNVLEAVVSFQAEPYVL